MIVIKVPCSSANIGPGFDVIGLALNIYLELHISVDEPAPETPYPLNCRITYSGEGEGSPEISLNADHNLLTRTALYVLRCHGQHHFPQNTHVHIINPIPLGRGLGSSGAAVVAGVILGNEVGKLNLPKERLLDYCLMIERHPDNVAAALYGGFVGTYLNELSPEDLARKEIPLSEVLPAPAGGIDTGLKPPEPPKDIGHFRRFKWAPEIKAIAIIPDFEVSTAKARSVLPEKYERKDMVSTLPFLPPTSPESNSHPLLPSFQIFNLQRLALLISSLSDSPPSPSLISSAMRDKIHQPYRSTLIPGLTTILNSLTPSTHPGLLGICLSGAGPTILALATHNFSEIAEAAVSIFEKEGNIKCMWKVLEPAEDGATVTVIR